MLNFENVVKSNTVKDENKYMLYMNGEDINKLFEKGALVYNHVIQRGYEEKVEKGKTKKVPILKAKKVEEIKKAMLNNDFYESTISLNITKDKEKVSIKYNPIYGDMTIEEKSLDILDGYHRITALKELADEGHLDLISKYNFPVEISSLEVKEAQKKFYQYTLGSKISTSRVEFFNNSDVTSNLIKSLMTTELKGRVETSKNVISKKSEEKIVTFSTLSMALNNCIDLNAMTVDEINTFEQFLNFFFSELLVEIDGFYYLDKRKVKDEITYDNFTFYGYIALAVHLYNTFPEVKEKNFENIPNEISIIKHMDMNRSSELWKDIVMEKKDYRGISKYLILNNKSTRKIMATLFIREFKKAKEKINMNIL